MSGLGVTEELLGGAAAPVSRGTRSAPASDAGGSITDELLSRFPQSMSADRAPADRSQIPDIADDPKKALPIDIVLKAGFFPDDKEKLDYLAQATGIDRARFGVVDGNIVYADPATNRYARAIPSVVKAQNPLDLWQRATIWAAGETVPAVPGIVGGAVGAAMGPTGLSIPAAGAAAGITDVVRQAIGNAMLEGDQSGLSDIDWLNSLGQGLTTAAGQGLAVGINKAMTRNPLKISPYDRTQAMDPATLQAARQARQDAADQGVDLSFGQATNLRSGLSAERQLARDPVSMDRLDQFYGKQRGQVAGAVDRFTNSVSPVQNVDEGVNAMREGADTSLTAAQRAVSAKAGPLYSQAYQANQAVASPMIDRILETPAGKDALKRAAVTMQNDMSLVGKPDPELTAALREAVDLGNADPSKGGVANGLKLRTLDYVQRELWDMAEAAKNEGRDTTQSRIIRNLRSALVDQLDKLDVTAMAGPNSLKPEGGLYAQARKAYAADIPEVNDLRAGIVGTLAKKEGTERIGEIRNLFNANLSNPAAVGKARAAFDKAGQAEQWNAGVATYLRDALDASSKSDKGLSAQRLVTAVYGDERQKRLLQAAMTPDQFDGFTRLMNVVQHVARTLPEGSPTATDAAGMGTLRSQFAKPVAMAKAALNMQFGDALLDRATLRLTDAGMDRLAKAVTDPGSIELLKKLRMLDPRSQQALVIGMQALGVIAPSEAGLRDARGPAPAAMTPDRPAP